MYYQQNKKKKGNKIAELPLCSLNLISLWGMCSGKRQSLFNFQFCLPLLSSADPRLGLLGLKIVCLKQNRRRVARPDLCSAWCRRGGFILFFFLFVCRLFFMWNAHCQAKTAPAFARCDLTHTHKHTRRLEVGHVGSVENTNNRKGSNFSFLLFCYVTSWKYDTMRVDH